MKKYLYFLIISVFVMSFSFKVNAQQPEKCQTVFPVNKGTEFKLKHYTANGKHFATSVYKFENMTKFASHTDITFAATLLDSANQVVAQGQHQSQCMDRAYLFDVAFLIDPQVLIPLKGKQIKTSGDKPSYPFTYNVDEAMVNGNYKIEVFDQGKRINTISMKMANRKIIGMEKMKSPVGTFDAYKVSYDIEWNFYMERLLFVSKVRVVEWVAPGTGILRVEQYDNSGILNGYSELSELKKGEPEGTQQMKGKKK